jgi:hypothetical protein
MINLELFNLLKYILSLETSCLEQAELEDREMMFFCLSGSQANAQNKESLKRLYSFCRLLLY